MKTLRLAAAGACLLLLGTRACAHRLDEYLQATTISVEKTRVQMQIRLTPGVAVSPAVLASIDTNGDGDISASEQRAYAEQVLRDFSLTVDGNRLRPRLISWKFAGAKEMKAGLGGIELSADAQMLSRSRHRSLVFENHHQRRIAVYLVNCLVPSDPDIQVTAQNRNYQQSFYQLDYVQTGGARTISQAHAWRSSAWGWLGTAALLLGATLPWLWRQRVKSVQEGRELDRGNRGDESL